MASPPTTLSHLPIDITNEICSQLSHASLCAIELTCHTLHQKISLYKEIKGQEYKYKYSNDDGQDQDSTAAKTSRKPSSSSSYTIVDLLEIETWPCYTFPLNEPLKPARREQALAKPDYFACHRCLKVRSARHFTNRMLARRKIDDADRLDGYKRYIETRRIRSCIDCCVARGEYIPGNIIRYGGWWLRGRGHGTICISCLKFKDVEVAWGRGLSCRACKELVLEEFRKRVEGRLGMVDD